jgi:osmotically-inducible protein OsmY
LIVSSVALGQQTEAGDRDFQRAVQDAWIDGRLEGAYIFNEHLSAAAIDTAVKNGAVTLSGTVESDIDRDLAAEIAKGMKGVVSVDNQLRVAGEGRSGAAAGGAAAQHRDVDRGVEADERRSFGQWVNDATTSAAVKAALVRNDNIRAADIDVETDHDVVTLRGVVASKEQKELAEQLAKNTRDVKQVRNELRVGAG